MAFLSTRKTKNCDNRKGFKFYYSFSKVEKIFSDFISNPYKFLYYALVTCDEMGDPISAEPSRFSPARQFLFSPCPNLGACSQASPDSQHLYSRAFGAQDISTYHKPYNTLRSI